MASGLLGNERLEKHQNLTTVFISFHSESGLSRPKGTNPTAIESRNMFALTQRTIDPLHLSGTYTRREVVKRDVVIMRDATETQSHHLSACLS